MRRKFLAGLMMLSMTASLFSNAGYTSVNAAEYETNVNTSAEAEDEVATTEEVTTEDATTETESTEEVLTEASTTEEDNVDSIEEELYDTSEDADSGQYETWSWSLDEKGVLLVDGVVTEPENGWPWKSNRSKIKAVKVTGSGESSLFGMFSGCENLSTIDLSNFDTSNVTTMVSMFYDCSSISNLDLSNFNTKNVTSMGYMFYGCSSISSLDLSNFDTSNVTGMSCMFEKCRALTSLDLSNFDTSNVTTMESMFRDCENLRSLDVRSFDTGNVKSMEYMFRDCENLSSLDVSNFDTGSVTNMYFMFYDCSSISSLDVRSFDTSNVTYMDAMFSGCSSVSSLDLSNFNTSKVIGMGAMFSCCSNISSLNLSNFDTSNVIGMDSMFFRCSSVSSLDLSNFDTSNVTTMSGMFACCENLSSLDVSNFNTSKVTWMSGMFEKCKALTSLDLSNFDTSNVIDIDNMFTGCNGLTEIKAPYNISTYIDLPTVADYMWLDEDNNEVSVMRQNCSTSITYHRSEKPTVYTIKFDGNDATGGTMSYLEVQKNDIGTIPVNQYSKTGYIFAGWNTVADGSGEAFGDEEDVSKLIEYMSKDNHTVTLYAQWKPISYTIHFDKNTATSGSMKRVYPKYGRNYRLPACGFKKPGYAFAGWNTRKDGKGTAYKNQSNVKNLTTTNGKVIMLYAQWRKITVSTPAKPTLGNYAAGRLTVTCKAVKGADGYLIQYATNKNMKNAKAVSSTTLKKNIYNLKKGTTYYVRVRAYKVDSAGKKVYGKFSAVQYKKLTK